MITHAPFGPTRKACTRCRLHKRKCNKAQPSCGLCNRLRQPCVYEESVAYVTPPEASTEEAWDNTPSQEALEPVDVKGNIIARLPDTDPREIMTVYFENIHPWFGVLSQSALSGPRPTTWDTISVEFALLCFAIVLLNSTPQELQGAYTLHSEHRSMYLMSKTWVSLLEGAGLNSIDFVKARLLITLFEVSHGFNIAAYISIANTVRAADALVVFQQEEVSQMLTEEDLEEYRMIWCGIAILDRFAAHVLGNTSFVFERRTDHSLTICDRYIATENGKWPPVTKCRPIPPENPLSNPLNILEHPSNPISRLFEASTLLENVHTALNQPTPQVSFNIEEATMIVKTLQSFEAVVNQEIPPNSRLFSSCLTLSSTALLFAAENGTKTTSSCVSQETAFQANAFLDTVIDGIVEMVTGLNVEITIADELCIPPFVTFLIYKAAAITTGRLQNGIESEANMRRLKVLRKSLSVVAQRWLAGGKKKARPKYFQ